MRLGYQSKGKWWRIKRTANFSPGQGSVSEDREAHAHALLHGAMERNYDEVAQP